MTVTERAIHEVRCPRCQEGEHSGHSPERASEHLRLRSLPHRRGVALLVACFASACSARGAPLPQPWYTFIQSDSLSAGYDTSRLSSVGTTTDVWIRMVPRTAQPLPNDSSVRYATSDAEERVNCRAHSVQDVRILLRDAAGDSVAGYTAPTADPVDFARHPLSERILVPLCQSLDSGTRDR